MDEFAGIKGEVRDAESGQPVAGVKVLAWDYRRGRTKVETIATTISDAQGRFSFRRLPFAERQVHLYALGHGWIDAQDLSGYWSLAARNVILARGRTVTQDIRVRPAATLEGVIRSEKGLPVEGVVVAPLPWADTHGNYWSDAFPWFLVGVAETDSAGRFRFPSLPESEGMRFQARSRRHPPVETPALVLSAQETTHVEVTLPEPRFAEIEVVAVGDASPVPNAEVRFRRSKEPCPNDPADTTGITDHLGRVVLGPLSPDPAWMKVAAEGFLAQTTRGDAWDGVLEDVGTGRYRAHFSLVRGSVLRGCVERGPGLPAEAVTIRAAALDAPGYERFSGEAPLGADDRFALSVPTKGLYSVWVKAEVEGREYEAWEEARPGDGDLVLRADLLYDAGQATTLPDAVWKFRVLGPDGKPVSHAEVRILAGVSDLNPLLPPGCYEELPWPEDAVLAVPVTWKPELVWVNVGGVVPATETPVGDRLFGPYGREGGRSDLRLSPPLSIRGQVSAPSGGPAQGVWITARPARPEGMPDSIKCDPFHGGATTDEDGGFNITGLSEGDYVLEVEEAKAWVAPAVSRVAAGTEDVAVHLLPSTHATLVVATPEGHPLVGAHVFLDQKDGLRGRGGSYGLGLSLQTGTDGTVKPVPLEQGGVYELRIAPPKDREDLAGTRVARWTPCDQRFVLKPLLDVRGSVVSPAGTPIADARVTIRQPDGELAYATTDAAGQFLFTDVPQGTIRVGAQLPAQRSMGELSMQAEAGDHDLVITLDPGRKVTIFWSEPASAWGDISDLVLTPLSQPADSPRFFAWIEDGRAEVSGVKPGVTYRVWGGPTKTGRYIDSLLTPEDEMISVQWRRGGDVRGRVVLPEGHGNADVEILEPGIAIRTHVRPDGSFLLRGVPPGHWTIQAFCYVGEQACTGTVTGGPGDDVEIEVSAP